VGRGLGDGRHSIWFLLLHRFVAAPFRLLTARDAASSAARSRILGHAHFLPEICLASAKSAIERLISSKARLGGLLTRFRENRLGEGGKTKADEKPNVSVV
jgi:hypothetical protein